MKYLQECFIRKNSAELREKLAKIGYKICPCCTFDSSEWLSTMLYIDNNAVNPIERIEVHGIGYYDELFPFPKENRFEEFVKSNLMKEKPEIDCGENEDLFLAIAALRDDTDKYQWFFSTGWTIGPNNTPIPDKWVLCDQDTLEDFAWVNNSPNSYSRDIWKKATIEDLINHFKTT